jgi:hypothetical protein
MRRLLRNPVFLLAFAAGLIAFAAQSGDTGTSDTAHRLQTAHSFWTSTPPVYPNEYPEFGVHGRNGSIQSWFGIGQSLLLLPADVVGTYLERLPAFADYNGNDPGVRTIFVSYTVSMFLTIMTALVCFRFLRHLNFGTKYSIAGTLALLLMTTHLHYTQNLQENNYIFLLTLTGLLYQLKWLRTGKTRALIIGSAAFGLNLLTRITTGMDLLAGGLFILLVMWFENVDRKEFLRRCRDYLAGALPVYLFFILLDRLYQFYRFGSFFNTYIGLVTVETKARMPGLPASYPWTTPFETGFFGALFSPEKSIFLFDPLLILMLALALVAWRRFSATVKAYTVTMALLLLAYLSFYARYFAWAGDDAWGDRYVSTTVELAALLAVPLLLRYHRQLSRWTWGFGVALMGWSLLVQMASLAFWMPLELYQMETLGHPTFVIGLRFKNILAFALGKTGAWGLVNKSMTQDPWDYVHITSWNFLPFQLARIGEAPRWVVNLALALWDASLFLLVGVLWRLRKVLKRLIYSGSREIRPEVMS